MTKPPAVGLAIMVHTSALSAARGLREQISERREANSSKFIMFTRSLAKFRNRLLHNILFFFTLVDASHKLFNDVILTNILKNGVKNGKRKRK